MAEYEYMEAMRRKYFVIDSYTSKIMQLIASLSKAQEITERVQTSPRNNQEELLVKILEAKKERSAIIDMVRLWRRDVMKAAAQMDDDDYDLICMRYVGPLPDDRRVVPQIMSWGEIAEELQLTGKDPRSQAKHKVKKAVEILNLHSKCDIL